jgi:hypothetical protein
MRRPSITAALLMLTLGCTGVPAPAAEPAASVQMEVNFLLDAVERSGCQFYRNGTWRSAHDARVHLRDKYDWLVARDLVHATEQFIDRAATQSSLSGQPYWIRCTGEPAIASNQWLRDRLAQFREHP